MCVQLQGKSLHSTYPYHLRFVINFGDKSRVRLAIFTEACRVVHVAVWDPLCGYFRPQIFQHATNLASIIPICHIKRYIDFKSRCLRHLYTLMTSLPCLLRQDSKHGQAFKSLIVLVLASKLKFHLPNCLSLPKMSDMNNNILY